MMILGTRLVGRRTGHSVSTSMNQMLLYILWWHCNRSGSVIFCVPSLRLSFIEMTQVPDVLANMTRRFNTSRDAR